MNEFIGALRRVAPHAAGALLVVFISLWGRASFESRRELAAARLAWESGRPVEALAAYREAVRWAAPYNPWRSAAVSELRVAIDSAIDPAEKIFALRELVRGLVASRGVVTLLAGESELAAAAEAEIDRLEQERGNGRSVLETRPPRVRYLPQAAAQLFFFGWITSAAVAIFSGITPAGEIRRRPLAVGVGVTLVLAVCWVAALRAA